MMKIETMTPMQVGIVSLATGCDSVINVSLPAATGKTAIAAFAALELILGGKTVLFLSASKTRSDRALSYVVELTDGVAQLYKWFGMGIIDYMSSGCRSSIMFRSHAEFASMDRARIASGFDYVIVDDADCGATVGIPAGMPAMYLSTNPYSVSVEGL